MTSTQTNKGRKEALFMRPGVFLIDSSEHNLRLVAQCGATDIVAPCPVDFATKDKIHSNAVQELANRISAFGMKLSVIERFVPHRNIVHDLEGRDEEIENIKHLIQQMGAAGVEVLCYNWMPSDDWTRTAIDIPERGGALVTSFDISKTPVQTSGNLGAHESVTSREKLWDTLQRFLQEVLPVAEEAGVALALHPDDPPLPVLNGQPQILYNVNEIIKVINMFPNSKSNGICFCQGTFASGGEDIPTSIRKIGGNAIKFVHFRNVVYEAPGVFREAWQDTGDIDNYEAMKAYYDIGFRGVIRPDHVPTLDGEDNSQPGYHVLGRLFALGYMRGLIECIGKSSLGT